MIKLRGNIPKERIYNEIYREAGKMDDGKKRERQPQQIFDRHSAYPYGRRSFCRRTFYNFSGAYSSFDMYLQDAFEKYSQTKQGKYEIPQNKECLHGKIQAYKEQIQGQKNSCL